MTITIANLQPIIALIAGILILLFRGFSTSLSRSI